MGGLIALLRKPLAALALTLTAFAPALAGPAPCSWNTPQPWPVDVVNRWSGACAQGRAQGRGVLRALRGAQVVQAFYGRYDAGKPVLGAVEVEGGFRVGRFGPDGQVLADGDRNTAIRAFDEAAAAARGMAASQRGSGNKASARFYEAKARQLAQQLD